MYGIVENFEQGFFFLTGNLKGRLERPGRRYEDNIKINVKERKREYVDWFYLTQDTKKKKGYFECLNDLLGFVQFGKILII